MPVLRLSAIHKLYGAVGKTDFFLTVAGNGGLSGPHLLAGEPQLRPAPVFRVAKAPLFLGNIVSREWYDSLPLGQLDLHDHIFCCGRTSRTRRDKIPTSAQMRVVDALRIFPMGEKSLAPCFQRFCVVQAQDFNVRHQQAGAFDLRQNFRQRRNITPGKMYLAIRDW